MEDEFFINLRKKIQPYFGDKNKGHGMDHTLRVYNNAIKISEGEESIDMDVIKASALLHDVARSKEELDISKCHASEGATMAKDILNEADFPKDKIDSVCHAIVVHRYSKGLRAGTKEAEILQDADRLDALGALVVARVLARAGSKKTIIHDPNIMPSEIYDGSETTTAINHFYEKILKIKPETFKTIKAREMAEGRYKFAKDFVERFVKEWEGEL